MLKQTMILFALLCMYTAEAQDNTYPIIPKPQSVKADAGYFVLDSKTVLEAANPAAYKSLELFGQMVEQRYRIKLTTAIKTGVKHIIIESSNDTVENEAYHLEVNPKEIKIKGGPAGSFYALQSLFQLIRQQEDELIIPSCTIEDRPAFTYRGLMIDAARHYFSLEEMKKIIDVMALFKLNRLHWHLTDDQGWRLEIKKYPKLTQIAAWRDSSIIGRYNDFSPFLYDGRKQGGFYTREEARNLVTYAAERKITVIPEIELPGHSTAVLAAYPEFGCKDTAYRVPGYWGVHASILAPKEKTFRFLEDVLTEVMEIFPSEYIHIGGDEVPKVQWQESEDIQRFIRTKKLKDEHELQSYFVTRIEKFLNRHGRKIIGWDEILEGGLAPNATVMSWRGENGGIAAARLGHDVIMTPENCLYTDYYQSKDTDNEPSAIGGFLPLDQVYNYHPVPELLTTTERKHILGVQANMWTEYVDNNNKLEYMLFPRVLALSEIAWTCRTIQNYDDFFISRLPAQLKNIEAIGVFFRIPEARVKFSIHPGTGRKTAEIISSVAGSTVYYTVDNHIASQTSALYTGPVLLPFAGKREKPVMLRYVIVTPEGRMSNEYSIVYNK